uniref:C2 domain-containing protein n=1 Tax=Plectus sambesii TaxID=2011161 RepID=A0A914UZ32_9BILA
MLIRPHASGRTFDHVLSSPSPPKANYDAGRSKEAFLTEQLKDDPQNVVELSVKCKNLPDRDVTSRSDPICVVHISEYEQGPWTFVGRSERVVNSLNPEFLTKFQVNYFFEKTQYLKFELYDVDNDYAKYSYHDFLGSAIITLGEIVGAFGSTVHKKLTFREKDNFLFKNNGSIIVSSYDVVDKKQPVLLQFRAQNLDRKDFLGKSDPFFHFYRINDDNSSTLLHRSEVIQSELNPTWKPFKVQLRQIADNKYRQMEVVCFDHDQDGRHDTIGSFKTTYEYLKRGPGPHNLYEVKNSKKEGKRAYRNSGCFELIKFAHIPVRTFLDYIRGGTQIHFTVAVDYSQPPKLRDNPHNLLTGCENDFQSALRAVGQIIQEYDSDKLFPALGYGARIPPNFHEAHDFFLNFQNDPKCEGVPGLLDAYKKAVGIVRPASSACFSHVIFHVAKFAEATMDGDHYHVLLMLTSGAISDMRQTISAIVNASKLPMSIIIVGVGRNDFSAMERLDADRKRLAVEDKKAERDIVQFVAYEEFKYSGNVNCNSELAKEVLKEVPRQLTSWMFRNNISPKPPVQVDGEQLRVTAAEPAVEEVRERRQVEQDYEQPRKTSTARRGDRSSVYRPSSEEDEYGRKEQRYNSAHQREDDNSSYSHREPKRTAAHPRHRHHSHHVEDSSGRRRHESSSARRSNDRYDEYHYGRRYDEEQRALRPSSSREHQQQQSQHRARSLPRPIAPPIDFDYDDEGLRFGGPPKWRYSDNNYRPVVDGSRFDRYEQSYSARHQDRSYQPLRHLPNHPSAGYYY